MVNIWPKTDSPLFNTRSRSRAGVPRGAATGRQASLLTSCTIGPKYRRPDLKPPDVFHGSPDATPPTDLTSLADLKWFDLFKDSQLQELIRIALVQNYDLRAAVARVDAARANLGITRADQFPTIAASADITTLRNSTSGAFPLPQSVQNRTFGGVALNLLSFEVDIWGRLRRATEAARADLLASEENRKAVMTTLAQNRVPSLRTRQPSLSTRPSSSAVRSSRCGVPSRMSSAG